jgi:hypothetical protein
VISGIVVYFATASFLIVGKLAGLEMVRLIREPVAAALAYGLNLKEDQTVRRCCVNRNDSAIRDPHSVTHQLSTLFNSCFCRRCSCLTWAVARLIFHCLKSATARLRCSPQVKVVVW